MNIKYTIQFHTYWHCGSGLSAGAALDALVIKDKNGLPYVPGKTMKGLIREAVNEILTMREECEMTDDYLRLFGYLYDITDEQKKEGESGNTDEASDMQNSENNDTEKLDNMKKSEAFFTNAQLPEGDAAHIVAHGLQHHLFTSIAQTAIKNGTAKDHSLRKTEVVVPCVLEGKIINVPASLQNTVLQALSFIKSLGVNRYRGLGRCTITGKEEKA